MILQLITFLIQESCFVVPSSLAAGERFITSAPSLSLSLSLSCLQRKQSNSIAAAAATAAAVMHSSDSNDFHCQLIKQTIESFPVASENEGDSVRDTRSSIAALDSLSLSLFEVGRGRRLASTRVREGSKAACRVSGSVSLLIRCICSCFPCQRQHLLHARLWSLDCESAWTPLLTSQAHALVSLLFFLF